MARSHRQQTLFFKGYELSFHSSAIFPIPVVKIPNNISLTIIRRLASKFKSDVVTNKYKWSPVLHGKV